jgi:hypothetical protein
MPMRRVDHPMVDGFTDEFLEVLAGPDGAGGCPHEYQIFWKGVEPKTESDPGKPRELLCIITLQEGHPGEVGVNGIGNQTLMLIVWDFLNKANKGEFPSRETAVTITKIEEAMQWNKQRELDRKKRGVLQTYQK